MSTIQYFGLSLSERLSKAGITDSFSAAIKANDASQMRILLLSVDYTNSSADSMIKTFLKSHESFHA